MISQKSSGWNGDTQNTVRCGSGMIVLPSENKCGCWTRFDRWCRERKPEVRQRILDYNEDDCRATRVLLDGVRALAV
jgi:hypothetical protein